MKELGLRVNRLPVQGQPHPLGSIELKSGCLGLLVPFEPGCSAEQVESTVRSGQPLHVDNGHVLVPLPPGTYDIVDESLAETRSDWVDDELGRYQARIRITRRTT
ncbi:hypothetical protein JQX13_12840 [Archangium violaceum]|uniref:hypothetical protein n=1 Tax=Archangium violaceum TaxID=83451 RepID=UPI00193B2585|nr:hypothetical protein [Archangium violaceum]QRK10874.1 hypothetical protein JQX13_12840 [Archangium violaceum]